MSGPQLIAFHLPQFHPTPENDEWWGKGFTEWRNVVRGRPLFRGHHQPHIPADLGFYDLRLPDSRQAQADLAQQYGIHGFCYYHYWFNGRRVLEQPVNEILASGQPNFPFCLCWANEHWTRAWSGQGRQVLLEQRYSREDDQNHIDWLCKAFADRRYIRIDGRPLFLVYRASQLPDQLATTTLWRERARIAGIGDLYLCRVERFPEERGDPRPLGFDAAVEFQPNGIWLGVRQFPSPLWFLTRPRATWGVLRRQFTILDYERMVRCMLARPPVEYPHHSCVSLGWDNSVRRRNRAVIFVNSSAAIYRDWLINTIQRQPCAGSSEQRIVFINAWNEWAEGCHLEPDLTFGNQYLVATKEALQDICK